MFSRIKSWVTAKTAAVAAFVAARRKEATTKFALLMGAVLAGAHAVVPIDARAVYVIGAVVFLQALFPETRSDGEHRP